MYDIYICVPAEMSFQSHGSLRIWRYLRMTVRVGTRALTAGNPPTSTASADHVILPASHTC